MENTEKNKAYFHLPGLFEFYDLYSVFLPLYREHRDYCYDRFEIASVYGAPADYIWGGGRVGSGECKAKDVLELMTEVLRINLQELIGGIILPRPFSLDKKKCA